MYWNVWWFEVTLYLFFSLFVDHSSGEVLREFYSTPETETVETEVVEQIAVVRKEAESLCD